MNTFKNISNTIFTEKNLPGLLQPLQLLLHAFVEAQLDELLLQP